MSFVIDLLDGSDVPIGDGPLNNVLSVSVTEALDEAGPIQFSLPATDYRAATLIDSAVKFRVRFDDGTQVYGLIGGDTIDAAGEQPVRQVNGFDLLLELANKSIGWWCFYNASDLNTVILPDLIGDTGWALGTVEASLGDFTQRFDGDSRLAALIKLTQQLSGRHFRMGGALRDLDFGAFGALSAVRLTNVPHILRAQDANSYIAIIGSLQLTSDRSSVIHRLYPWGAGNDGGDTYREKASLWYLDRDPSSIDPAPGVTDSRWADIGVAQGVRGATTIIRGVSDIGAGTNNQYEVDSTAGFIESPVQQCAWFTDPDDLTQPGGFNFVVASVLDATHLVVRGSPLLSLVPVPTVGATLIGNPQLYLQMADYDPAAPREAVQIFNDVKALDAQAGSLASVAPQLFMRAQRYLDTHAVPQRTYSISVLRAPYTLRVGDKVRVVYRGAVTRRGVTVNWIDFNEELFVINITRTYNADGSTAATIEVSNIDAQPLDDVGALADNSGQVGAMAVNAN